MARMGLQYGGGIMTRLEGFRCDNCGAESRDKPGSRWTEVRSLMMNSQGWSGIGKSDGLHYCRQACLKKAIETKWERDH